MALVGGMNAKFSLNGIKAMERLLKYEAESLVDLHKLIDFDWKYAIITLSVLNV